MVIYLDNAATSWPKPGVVASAMERFMAEAGANPGRAGHQRSIESGRTVYDCRAALAELFGVKDPLRIVFGANATEALNLALLGLLRPGDHVVTSSVEHNSVMRPLRALGQTGVELTVVPCAPDGSLDPAAVEESIRVNTKLIVLTHASNVLGTILPVAAVGKIARKGNLLFLVDSAATAGAVPIDVEADCIDLLAFTGHKRLYGPMGTGGLVVGPRVDVGQMHPLKRGGTGSRSELEEQPEVLPDIYESGTLNAHGLAGLAAGVRWILAQGVPAIREQQIASIAKWLTGLRDIPGVTLQGTGAAHHQAGAISFTVAGMSPSDVGFRLDEEFGVLCRVGLHCAPAAHRTMGTFPEGTVRFAPGAMISAEERQQALAAVATIARGGAR